MVAGQPALGNEAEQALKSGRIGGGVTQNIQRFGFVLKHGRDECLDDGFGVELVKSAVDFQRRCGDARFGVLAQRVLRCVLLTAQFAGHAAIKAQAQPGKVRPQHP